MKVQKDVVVLAAGIGSKMFPYNLVRSKTMIKIANIPVIAYNVNTLTKFCNANIYIVTLERFSHSISSYFEKYENVKIIEIKESKGSSDSLLQCLGEINSDSFLVLYGDTIIHEGDLLELYKKEGPSALVYKLREKSRNWIGAAISEGKISLIGAHYRGNEITHQFAGFNFDKSIIRYVEKTPDFFPDLKVGVAPPEERYLEAALSVYLKDNNIEAIEGRGFFFDIDKPWHMLEANYYIVNELTGKLTENKLGKNSVISPNAKIKGFVQLGENSYIGDNVLIEGNLIVGDNTIIDNGAIFTGCAAVGNNTSIKNYCKIHGNSSIGDYCIIDHTSEFLGGIIMDSVYLYHYGEFFGAIGTNTDIGAATVCGTLRFDDGETTHSVKGRKEIPLNFSNAVYLGDYCRTGVNAIIMPGCKVGSYSVVGPGVVLNGDVDHNTLVYVKQELVKGKWGPERYGW